MNYGELNELLSTLLADSSNNFYTEAERRVAINQACRHMNTELRILLNVADITVTSLDESVPLPEDFVSLGRGLDWVTPSGQVTSLGFTGVSRLRQRDAGWEASQGIPELYVMEGGRLILYPKPKETGTVRMSYVSMPNVLELYTDPPFYGDPRVQAYHELISYRAAWQLAMKDRDFEAAQQFMAYFQARMVDLRENLRQTGDVDSSPMWGDTYRQ
jgi:hypothetical protein